MSLSGKVVLITGTSKGIGKATAQRLASEGASVVLNYNTDAPSANELVQEIGQDRALAVQADASKLPDLYRLVDAAVAKFGKIDVLIPNAGIMPMRDLEHTTEEDFDRVYNITVKGPYFLAQVLTYCLPIELSSVVTDPCRKQQSTSRQADASSSSQQASSACPTSPLLISSTAQPKAPSSKCRESWPRISPGTGSK